MHEATNYTSFFSLSSSTDNLRNLTITASVWFCVWSYLCWPYTSELSELFGQVFLDQGVFFVGFVLFFISVTWNVLFLHLNQDGFKTVFLLILTLSWDYLQSLGLCTLQGSVNEQFKQPTGENLKLQTTKNNQRWEGGKTWSSDSWKWTRNNGGYS